MDRRGREGRGGEGKDLGSAITVVSSGSFNVYNMTISLLSYVPLNAISSHPYHHSPYSMQTFKLCVTWHVCKHVYVDLLY